MPLLIHEMTAADSGPIREFNSRLASAGIPFTFPTDARNLMRGEPGIEAPHQTAYVLTDGAAVRGGYILKAEALFVDSECLAAGNFQLPLSEGIIDRRYAIVGVQLIKDALRRQSRLYCLGMGNTARPLPQLLRRLGWTIATVPFLFRIENAGNFSREMRWLRRRRSVRYALNLSRYTGVLAAVVALQRQRRRAFARALPADAVVSEVSSLPMSVDELFAAVGGEHGLLCDRRAAAMNTKLPPSDERLSRLVLYRSGRLLGWTVVSRSRLKDHAQFGDMTVGCIVDGLAAPADAAMLVAAACRHLEAARCDLLVSNQTHPLWISALRQQGFHTGPSNFVLALSPDLAALAACLSRHFTRGDGDGPINL